MRRGECKEVGAKEREKGCKTASDVLDLITLRPRGVVHPRESAGIVRSKMDNPTPARRRPGGDKMDGKPGVDEHGCELKHIDVKLPLRESGVFWRFGGKNRPTR